jgi:cell division protein FtsL
MNETVTNDAKQLAQSIANETQKILTSEKANRFFRIGFFITLALLIISLGLTIYTRFIPRTDNPLKSVVAEQQSRIDSLTGTINELTELNRSQQESLGQLEGVDRLREAGIARIERIVGDAGTAIKSTQSGNLRAEVAFNAIARIVDELEKLSTGNTIQP